MSLILIGKDHLASDLYCKGSDGPSHMSEENKYPSSTLFSAVKPHRTKNTF